ncbi:MAG: hypothetical protein ABSC49_03685 [Candidatus Microgenomates bacterium]|jgi:hypothetical protein
MKALRKFIKKYQILVAMVLTLGVIFFAICVYQLFYLKWAHSTFENYYSFRGCQQLLTRTDTEGTCMLKNGKVIKLVKYQGRWFLDGDLPGPFPSW